MINVIDLHHRPAGAGGEAFFLAFQVDAAIFGAFANLDAELVFDMLDDASEPISMQEILVQMATLWRATGFVSNIE